MHLLKEAESNSKRWESEVREATEKAVRTKVEREVARHEVAMARLETEAVDNTRAQMESELARVQRTLVASEDAWRKVESELDRAQQALDAFREAWRKAEEEVSHLTDERVFLLIGLGASKDELSVFLVAASKEKKALEEEFDASFEVIFNYGYGCCAFAHNICGSKPQILAGMLDTSKRLPPEFFINPRCPPSAAPKFLPPILA